MTAMFETAELGHKLKKSDFQELVPTLRSELVELQRQLAEADFPVLVVIEGDDRVGIQEAVNRANQWLDPRFLSVEVYPTRGDDEHTPEAQYPWFWRYWLRLPERGRIGIFVNAWTVRAILEEVRLDKPDELLMERRLRHIQAFEQMLVDDGALLIKVWLHVPRSVLKERIKEADKDPVSAWRVSGEDRLVYENHERIMPLVERVIQRTSTGGAPWHVVESTDPRFRDVTIAQLIRHGLEARLARTAAPLEPPAPERAPGAITTAISTRTILDTVDLSATLNNGKYEKQLERWQAQLAWATQQAFDRGVSSVLVFQGWDAAGKGGTIRRMSDAIDAAICRIMPIAAPSEDERAHHYMWRFWRRLPRRGRVRIFDRSWYERVLVERIERFASEAQWRRAYAEIRDFEEQLAEHGVLLLKFWLHIDPDEQLRRFEERKKTAFKQHKITDEDYRNRKRWGAYELAVNEMVSRTDAPHAPWHLVPANDKRYARVEVIKTFVKALDKRLEETGAKSG